MVPVRPHPGAYWWQQQQAEDDRKRAEATRLEAEYLQQQACDGVARAADDRRRGVVGARRANSDIATPLSILFRPGF